MNTTDKNFNKVYMVEISKLEKRLKNLVRNKEPKSLYVPAHYMLGLQGKLLRPFLLLLSAKAVGGSFNKVYNAAVAIESAHISSLVHDDLMDKSTKRRSSETLHEAYNVDTSIIVGDRLIVEAYSNLLKDCGDNAKEIVAIFTNAAVEVCEGQSMDMEFETRKDVSLTEYKKMIYKKTAALIEASCLIGATLSGATKTESKAVSQYGKYIGMAFQIQDDLLDIVSEEETLGKNTGNDLMTGKKTYLFIRALKKAKGGDKKLLLKIIKNKGISPVELDIYKNLYSTLGVIKEAQLEVVNYTKSAIKSLSVLPDNEGRRLMTTLAGNLISRNK